jgi:hypothetical protein
MEQSAPVLGELLILIEGVLQTFAMGQSLRGGGSACSIHLKGRDAYPDKPYFGQE